MSLNGHFIFLLCGLPEVFNFVCDRKALLEVALFAHKLNNLAIGNKLTPIGKAVS